MTHHDRTTRNVILAIAVTLLLAASTLAQDSETVLAHFYRGQRRRCWRNSTGLLTLPAISTVRPFQAATIPPVANPIRASPDAAWCLS